jgi:hypothetical protein
MVGTFFENIETGKYWNEADKTWVEAQEEATNYGDRKQDKKFTQPKNSVRVRVNN